MIDHKAPRIVIQYPETKAARVQQGRWRVRVQAEGFLTTSAEVDVGESNAFLPVCMVVAPIEMPLKERPLTVFGKVTLAGLGTAGRPVLSMRHYCTRRLEGSLRDPGHSSWAVSRNGVP